MDNSIVQKIIYEIAQSFSSLVAYDFEHSNNVYEVGVEVIYEKMKNVDYMFSRSKECAFNEKAVKIVDHYDLYPGDFILNIGCLRYPLDFWQRNFRRIGVSYGMTTFEINIYKYLIDMFVNLEKQSRKYYR